jgi:hypothetical protein
LTNLIVDLGNARELLDEFALAVVGKLWPVFPDGADFQ